MVKFSRDRIGIPWPESVTDAVVDAKVQAAIAADQTVAAAAAAAVDANPTIAYTNPGETGTSGKALIQGPSSPKWGDMETVVFDHVFERSATPATNRVNLQTLLDRVAPGGSGKQVRMFIPPRFDINGNPDPIVLDRASGAWCLDLPSHVAIEGAGAGSTLKLADGQGNFTRILNADGKENIAIRRLRLDGNNANNNTSYQHNHNIMIYDTRNVVVDEVTSINATGDGIYVGGEIGGISQWVWITNSHFEGNTRNPISVCDVDDAYIINNRIFGTTGGEAIDSEPNGEETRTGLTVIGNTISHPLYAMSTGGFSSAAPRKNTRFIGNNIISGGFMVVYTQDTVISGNTGTITQVYGNHYNKNISITNNIFDVTTNASRLYAVSLQRSSGGTPENIHIAGNTFTSSVAGGIQVWGGTGHRFINNRITGAVTAGVNIRPTGTMQDIVIAGNVLTGSTRGVYVQAYTTTEVINAQIVNNIIRGTSISGIDLQTTPMPRLHMSGNILEPTTGGISGSQPYTISGQGGNAGIWSVVGTPEGVITERIGAVAYRRDGGTGTTMYVKESGTGNTGWVAK